MIIHSHYTALVWIGIRWQYHNVLTKLKDECLKIVTTWCLSCYHQDMKGHLASNLSKMKHLFARGTYLVPNWYFRVYGQFHVGSCCASSLYMCSFFCQIISPKTRSVTASCWPSTHCNCFFFNLWYKSCEIINNYNQVIPDCGYDTTINLTNTDMIHQAIRWKIRSQYTFRIFRLWAP